MPSVIRKLLLVRNLLSRRKPEPDEITEEKWNADFSKQKHVRFNIKSESSYDANLRKNLSNSGHSLVLTLKKAGCMAWVEAPDQRYRDLVISGDLRVDARGGYAAGGILFRMVDSGTYYSFLISSKGYFRLDALRNGMPFPLIGWTELPLSSGAVLGPDQAVDFSVIAYGSHIVVLIRGRWAAEVNDSSIPDGAMGFTAVSYESGDPDYKAVLSESAGAGKNTGAAEIFLESLALNSRIIDVSTFYGKWRDNPEIDPKARFSLAETFTAMDQYNAAMVQLRKGWETPGHRKTQKELLLAGRIAQQLELMTDAESYTSQCFQADVESAEGREAVTEMAKILYITGRYAELRDYCAEAVKIKDDDPVLWNFQGHAYWNLKEYRKAAPAYEKAFDLERENGITAKNAANVFDVMGRKKDALKYYLEAGKSFLKAANYNDLGLVTPKLLSLGGDNWETHCLAGKWAFAVEDWKMAETEFALAEELRKARRPKPKKDGAQVFLEALLLIRKGKRREALPLLKEASALEKDFALFHFRLAENLFLENDDPGDELMLGELDSALSLAENDARNEDEGLPGWINNFAAQVALRKGDLDTAAKRLEKAVRVLGNLPAVKVNQGVLFYLQGSADKAMELLDADRQDDPEGVMANCAGNLLVRSGRFEEADEKYRKALAAFPDNVEYLTNRSSCLMELGLYGEADEVLTRAYALVQNPAILEMISFVAARKGEYARAEQACRLALEMDPSHAPSMLSLGWILLTVGRQAEARELMPVLDKLDMKDDVAKGREELHSRLNDILYRTAECAACGRTWKLLKDPPSVPAIRLFAMPPEDLPAGTCPACGKTYCIGCAKENLDSSGRFTCTACNRTLKLVNDGLKKLIHDWAEKNGLIKKEGSAKARKKAAAAKRDSAPEPSAGKRPRGRPHEGTPKPEAPSGNAGKRGRGRPRKTEQPSAPQKRRRGRPPKADK